MQSPNTHWEQPDVDHHRLLCDDCGEVLEYGIHSRSCTDSDKCSFCKIPHNGDSVLHAYDWEAWVGDGAQHWHICGACGKPTAHAAHVPSADNALVCEVCDRVIIAVSTPEPTAEPTVKPTKAPTEMPAPEHVHAFSSFLAVGNRMHTAICEGCSKEMSESCALAVQTEGSRKRSSRQNIRLTVPQPQRLPLSKML